MFFQTLLFRGYLDGDEKILYVGHKHWLEIFGKLFQLSFFGFFIPWIVFFILGFSALFWFAIIATIITYSRIFYILVDWYFDAVLITDHSLLFVEWHGFFHKQSTRISYMSIESISIETQGFWATMFGFGILSIERDAAEAISMNYIWNPKRLELEIIRAKEQFEDRNMSENKDAIHGILSEMVADYIRKNGWKH